MKDQSYLATLMEQYGSNNIGIRTLEIQIGNLLGKYVLPDDDFLREKQIFGFFMQNSGSGTRYAPDSSRPIVTDTILASSYLTLKCGNREIIYQHPLVQLAVSLGDREITPLNLQGLTPTQSYIQVANPSTILGGITQSFLLHFIYLK